MSTVDQEVPPHGDFTFVSSQGCSLVDFVICSVLLFPFISDGGLLPLASGSDHFPVFVTAEMFAAGTKPQTDIQQELPFRWAESMKYHFNANLSSSLVDSGSYSMAQFIAA